MNTVALPKDVEAWAEGEVAAGRATSVEELAARALAEHKRRLDDLKATLTAAEAEADEVGWIDAEEVFDELEARLEAVATFEAEWEARRTLKR